MSTENHFHHVRFPTDISFGCTSSVERRTEIVALGSGHEHRNQRWAKSRRSYDIGYGIKDIAALHQVASFFEAPRGALIGFLFRDPIDWKSGFPGEDVSPFDQEIGIGDSNLAKFNLRKTYGTSGLGYQREIYKPVQESLRVAVDDVELTLGGEVALIDGNTLEFNSSHVPQEGQVITAGFEFDVPVRFSADELNINIANFNAGEIPSIQLQEIRL